MTEKEIKWPVLSMPVRLGVQWVQYYVNSGQEAVQWILLYLNVVCVCVCVCEWVRGVALMVVWWWLDVYPSLLDFVSALQRITEKDQNIETCWNICLWKNMRLQMLMWQSGMLEPRSIVRLICRAVHQFEGKACKMEGILVTGHAYFVISLLPWHI
jgi:hypothetical protein